MNDKADDLHEAAHHGEYSYDFWKKYLNCCELEDRMKLLNLMNEEGLLPLHKAVLGERLKVVRDLLELGAEINAKDKNGFTALHYAINKQSDEMIEYLIQEGADINASAKDNITPLQLAKGTTSSRLIDFLISKGAR